MFIFEFIGFVGLAIAVYFLFQRIKTLEASLDELRQENGLLRASVATLFTTSSRAAVATEAPTAADPQPEPEPVIAAEPVAPKSVTVPAVALRRGGVVLTGAVDRDPSPAAAEPSDIPPDNSPRGFTLPRPSFDFEEIFGRRLPIWAGGVALAVSGVFLVRYSIEAGLLTPLVRVIMAFLFGLLLLGGAELAYRNEDRVADPRVRQALAGAGLATLYAAFYLAGSQYGLIGQTLAFVGLAAVTAAAIALSFRFGLPSAVLGLIGGFAAPALVGGDEANLPLLSLYLGLVTAGLTLTGQRQQRSWLGIAALVGGLGWGALLLIGGDFGVAGLLALGLYIIALGAVLPAFTGTQLYERPVRLAAALIASAQLALLVHQGGYAPLAWGLYLLLAAALAWFAWRKPELREANTAAAVIGVLLYAQWGSPPPLLFTVVGAALAAIFAGVPVLHIARANHRRIDLAQLALVGPALAAVGYGTFGDPLKDQIETLPALGTLALAAFPIVGAWLLRQSDDRRWFAGLVGSAAVLGYAAMLMVTPGWSAPLGAAAILAAPAWLAFRRKDAAMANLLWAGVVVLLASTMVTPHFDDDARRMAGFAGDSPAFQGAMRWMAGALVLGALALIEARPVLRRTAEALAAGALYAALAQVIPAMWLAWVAALLALAIIRLQPQRIAAGVALAGIALLWAVEPLFWWLSANLGALGGYAAHISDLPGLKTLALRILPLLACAALLPLPSVKGVTLRRGWLLAPLALVVVHSAYKQIFAIETVTSFVDYGMAERTVWEALLLAAAWAAHKGVPYLGRDRWLAVGLAGAALAHFALFSALLHNPLWDRQAVGSTPIANWALAACAVAIAAAVLLRQWTDERLRPVFDAVVMAIASLGAVTLLRQAFAGSVLVEVPMGQTEDLLRSLLGIVLALAFLWLGSIRKERSWRIGSLVLMLLAVAKVFLLDAAGLEGLLRIASFMALGFSLIGIGWIYSRQLRGDAPPAAETTPA